MLGELLAADVQQTPVYIFGGIVITALVSVVGILWKAHLQRLGELDKEKAALLAAMNEKEQKWEIERKEHQQERKEDRELIYDYATQALGVAKEATIYIQHAGKPLEEFSQKVDGVGVKVTEEHTRTRDLIKQGGRDGRS